MANQICVCGDGMGNMGTPTCDSIFKVAKKFIFRRRFNSLGGEQYIDPSLTLNLAWLTPFVNHADNSYKMFFTPLLKNIKMVKGDPIFETFEDNSSNFISENVRKATAELPQCRPSWKEEFEKMRCEDIGVYAVDILGNIIGCQKYGYNFLYPLPLNPASVYAAVMMAEDAKSQSIALQFEIPNTFDDSSLRMISAAAFTDFSMLNIKGLINANIAFSNIISGGVTATITTPSTDLASTIPIEGLVVTDFVSSVGGATSKIRDTTSGADVAITTVTESAPGVYNLTYTLAAAKVVVVFAAENGIDFIALKDENYTTV
ncbi:MAG: hypothetical protein V4547_18920 [Bacteroidota bacterium]